ncbi:peptide deformylase [Rhodohalobacter halophilus]|uniref:peptide deformylase n=1 Tax=Rhodohalobacter halophilus TaxID=1812810 RepID=UPI00083F939E|nr:peptide deformylase [Rhodohalobacter halophilus]
MSVLPIVTYNDPVLKQKTQPIDENSPELQKLIDDMFDTMYNSSGVGLAAPQIGKLIQLFVMDADAVTEEMEGEKSLGPLVLINPEIVETAGDKVKMEEGCLSIPDVRDDVVRPEKVKIDYLDRNFEKKTLEADGWVSRVIQHEYDHLQGVLFLDYLSAFRRRLHKSLLKKIDKGTLKVEYPVVPKG